MEKNLLDVTIIAGNIHQLRLAANLSQSELAKKLNVTQSAICSWELGQRYPKLINILAICNFFDVKVDDLIGFPSMNNKK